MNNVTLIGRLTADPELRFAPGSGMAVANFKLAVDKGLNREKQEEFKAQGKPTADFIPVVVWGKQAENCSQYLAKGRLAAVNGSIQTSTYQVDGQTRYKTEVLCQKVQFLEWGDKQETKASDDFSFATGQFEDFQSVEDDDSVPF